MKIVLFARSCDPIASHVERGDKEGLDNPFQKVIASTFLVGKEFIERIKLEYLEGKEIDGHDLPALKKILMRPSLESIERAVIKLVGRDHPLIKKLCIYLSYQRSGLKLREIGEYFGMRGVRSAN